MASEIKVDTISEKTSAGGVTIDGLLIKDGGISGDVSLIGTTPTFTIGDAGAEDATLLFDGNAQDFHIGLDDSSDDLVIGVGSALGTTTALAIDENAGSTFSGTVTVGVDDTGKDVKFFGATASRYWLWDESADGVVQRGTLTVGVDDTGHDVKLFGASAGAYMEWDESADELRIMGASADATTSTGKLLLATSLTDINANDVIGKIDFQAPHEAGGTDAITVAASIQAIAQGTFSSSVNATDLIFYTGHSEAAAEKIRFTSQNEIGIAGANYGTDGQVMTSAGAGAAVAWEDAAGFDVSSITGATDLAAIPDNADELVISDGGSLKRIDYKYLNPIGSIMGVFTHGNQTDITDATYVKILLSSADMNRGLTFASNKITIPAGEDGNYLLNAHIDYNTYGEGRLGHCACVIFKNGSHHKQSAFDFRKASDDYNSRNHHAAYTVMLPALNATDYLELYAYWGADQTTASYRAANNSSVMLIKLDNA
jgi:hypothetical protein